MVCSCRRSRFALLVVFVALSCLSCPAFAAKRITAEQLQQTLATAQSSHRPDDAVAKQLEDMELAARLSSTALQQLIAVSPGPKTTAALRTLSDQSAFLPPPAEEIPAKPAPDIATQKAMLAQTIHYVARTLPTLPDFLATRKTEHFDDSPHSASVGAWPTRTGFLYRAEVEVPIAFQDGRETDDPSATATTPSVKKSNRVKYQKPNASSSSNLGLSSWGEFGPILGLVLVDAAKGKLSWARWEQSDGKPAAVFQFSVDRSVSHYNVQYCCVEDRSAEDHDLNGILRTKELHQIVGYHGTLTIDPDTGTILRIVIETDLHPDDPIQRGAIMVEYGPVKIGSATYMCPTHSVALSLSHANYQASPIAALVDIVELQLNDATFTNYRRFGSEATLITASTSASGQGQTAPQAPDEAGTSTAAPTAGTAPPTTEAIATTIPASQPAPNPTPAPTSPAPPEPATAVASAAPASVNITPDASDEEVLLHSVNGMPGMEDTAAQPNPDQPTATSSLNPTTTRTASNGAFTLQVTTRLVDLGLIALDKHGKPVTDLRQDEIEVYDNGRKQQVHTFRHNGAKPDATQQAATPPSEPEDTFTNSPITTTVIDGPPDTLILLLDESHLPFQDLNRARGEVLRFLAATRPTSRIALYAFSEHGFRVIQDITEDHTLVAKKLASWMPSASSVSQAQDLEVRNRQQFDTVRSNSDLDYVNGKFTDKPDYIQSTDPQLRQMGQTPLRASLEALLAIAQHFAAVPGHKSVAWIAGDSVLADWDDASVGTDKVVQQLDAAIRHAREALSEAHIALYAVDASMQLGGQIDASLENRNVEVNQVARDNPQGGGNVRNGTGGRITASMQADLHGIQGPVRQLVESTGGRAINRGGDLKATLDSIDVDTTARYDLTFNPDTQADGKFHTLQLKIPSRKDVKLRYRTGYLYSEQAPDTKQRMTQAIWSAQDLTAISITAEAVIAADSPNGKNTVKLRIDFPGLDFQKKEENAATRWTDQLYIFLAERDDASQKAKVDGDTLRLSLKQATYESGMPAGIPYQHEVATAAKLGSIRIIVVDGNSGKMGSVTLPNSAFHPEAQK